MVLSALRGVLRRYITVGDGATLAISRCELAGAFAVRFDGWVSIRESTLTASLVLTGTSLDGALATPGRFPRRAAV